MTNPSSSAPGSPVPHRPAPHHPTTFERLRRTFLAGLLVIVPAIVCLWAVLLIMGVTDRFFGGFIDQIYLALRGEAPKGDIIYTWIKGALSLVLALAAVSFVGWLSTFLLIRKAIAIGESIVSRVPLIKFFYNTPKEVINTLTMPRKGSAKRVVLIEYPRRDIWCLAFATGEIRTRPNGAHLIAVFLPTTPNPTSGFLLYVPASDVLDTNIPVETGARMIISGGILSPDEIHIQKFSGLDQMPVLPPLPPVVSHDSVEPAADNSPRN